MNRSYGTRFKCMNLHRIEIRSYKTNSFLRNWVVQDNRPNTTTVRSKTNTLLGCNHQSRRLASCCKDGLQSIQTTRNRSLVPSCFRTIVFFPKKLPTHRAHSNPFTILEAGFCKALQTTFTEQTNQSV
jgi:hypothetical protein